MLDHQGIIRPRISQALGATHAEVSTHLIVTLKMNLFADEEVLLYRTCYYYYDMRNTTMSFFENENRNIFLHVNYSYHRMPNYLSAVDFFYHSIP